MIEINSRTKIILGVILIFISGKIIEYSYVRRLNTQLLLQKAPEGSHISGTKPREILPDHTNAQLLLRTAPEVTHFSEAEQRDLPDRTTGSIKVNTAEILPNSALHLEANIKITHGTDHQSRSYDYFFTILSDPRSGAEYVMNVLQQHESICSSGGYPTSALLPHTIPWISDDDVMKGCTLAYLRDSIGDITSQKFASRCSSKYDSKKDKYKNHLTRFCSFISALHNNHTDDAITNLFISAFAESNNNIYTSCSCPTTTQIRGIKVSTEWIGQIHLENTLVRGSKIIRLTRQNYFERYMSFIIANLSGQWSIQNSDDKINQLSIFGQLSPNIDIDDMIHQIQLMGELEIETKRWAEENGHQILWVDRSHILNDPVSSFKQIFDFLGVESKNSEDTKKFVRKLEDSNVIDVSLKEFDGAKLLEYISNRDQVVEALIAHGYGTYVNLDDSITPIHHVVLSNEPNFRVHNSRKGFDVTVINGKNFVDTNIEPSARLSAAISTLNGLPPNAIVILSNGKDASLNPHIRSSDSFFTAISELRKTLRDTLPPDAVLVSVSSDCCSLAMHHTRLGSLFDTNGQRSARTCRTGECTSIPENDYATKEWNEYMKQQSIKHGHDQVDSIYLDGTIIAGTVQNMLALIRDVDALPWEDDRAVLSDFMYRYPNRVMLDYDQKIFAGRFDGYVSKMQLDCDVINSAENFDETRFTRTPIALMVSSTRNQQSCTRNDKIETFPIWNDEGISISSVLDHIDRVFIDDVSMVGIDRHFDKEILYHVDESGVWASQVLRDEYRVKPTERFLLEAHSVLMTSKFGSNRWSNLYKTVKSNGFPYWSWYGGWKHCNTGNFDSRAPIPLFTTCAMTTCNNSFPMPSYMTIIDSQIDATNWYRMFLEFDKKYKWEDKIRQVVWRGGLSENDPKRVYESQRWRFCKLVTSLPAGKEKDMFNVGLTNIPDFLTAQIDINASIVGGIVDGISPMNDFQKYIAVLDFDGNSWSSRFGTMLCYNSVAIKVEPAYADYWIYDLVPWKHYIPIKNDLSDVVENIAFALDPANDGIVQEIIFNANQWCSERFTQQALISDMLDIWEDYVQMLDRADPDWSLVWDTRKKSLLSSSSKVPLVKLTPDLLR
jgi:Glycosyl transferase family 90/Stf0 sulphotransferase